MHDLAACGMADQAQCGLGGDRLPPGTGVGVDRKTRTGGGREAAAVRADGRALAPMDRPMDQESSEMGEIVASMELENAGDREVVSEGLRDESTVRRATVEGVVDTGAVMLMLPEDVVSRLGLRTRRQVTVTYANEYRETRQVAGPVTVQIGNRFMNTDCIIGPPLSEPLIGQIVLEALDLVADCANRTVGPRPESPDRPLLKLK